MGQPDLEAPVADRGPVSPWTGSAGLLLAAQFVAATYMWTLPPEGVSTPLAGSVLAVSVFAAAAVGIDAWRTRGEWSPNPLLWGLPVLVPALGLGVLLAYLGRGIQTDRDRPAVWVWPAAGASLLAGVAVSALAALGGTTPPMAPAVATLYVAFFVFAGLAAPAAYYDTRYVADRLSGSDRGWPLRGYHWVVLLALPLPLPLAAPAVGAYLLRRWLLLRGLPPAVDDKT